MTSVNAKHEALLDELLKDYTSPQDILGEHGLLKQLTKRVVERVLEAELTAHLGYAPWGVATFHLKTPQYGRHTLFLSRYPQNGGGNRHDDRTGRICTRPPLGQGGPW